MKKKKKLLPRTYLIDLKVSRGIKTDHLAERIYLDKKNYYQLESGARGHKMGAILFVRLAEELDVDVGELVKLEAEYQLKRIELGLAERPWYLKIVGK